MCLADQVMGSGTGSHAWKRNKEASKICVKIMRLVPRPEAPDHHLSVAITLGGKGHFTTSLEYRRKRTNFPGSWDSTSLSQLLAKAFRLFLQFSSLKLTRRDLGYARVPGHYPKLVSQRRNRSRIGLNSGARKRKFSLIKNEVSRDQDARGPRKP